MNKKHTMFINIITPCTRVENLQTIANSINIPTENFRWIVVIDGGIPCNDIDKAEIYHHYNPKSRWGNAQRNFGVEKIIKGFVYFLDDDTTLHNDFWGIVKDLDNFDFIHFDQSWKDGTKRVGGTIKINKVDSGNVLFHSKLIYNNRWSLHERYSDGMFIEACFRSAKKVLYIKKTLSIYNTLNPKTK